MAPVSHIRVAVSHGGYDAILLKFLFGCDTDMTHDGAGELGEEALVDYFNQEPVVHTWSFKGDKAI
jgi:hypothetical protein